jgi:Fe-S cluster biogenesis protein NfuA
MNNETKPAPHIIYAEMTPNPTVMKFCSNRFLVTNGKTYEIDATQRIGSESPLAEKLFQFPFINSVFIAENFVSITINNSVDWNDITYELRQFIAEYLNNGGEVIREDSDSKIKVENTSNENDNSNRELSEIEQKIVALLDEYVRPAVQQDGGAIDFHSFEDGVVKVVLKGSCSGCPSSIITLKNGIEQLLTSMMPEVKSVEALED